MSGVGGLPVPGLCLRSIWTEKEPRRGLGGKVRSKGGAESLGRGWGEVDSGDRPEARAGQGGSREMEPPGSVMSDQGRQGSLVGRGRGEAGC